MVPMETRSDHRGSQQCFAGLVQVVQRCLLRPPTFLLGVQDLALGGLASPTFLVFLGGPLPCPAAAVVLPLDAPLDAATPCVVAAVAAPGLPSHQMSSLSSYLSYDQRVLP